jgi:hypothetical protein
MDAAKEKPSVPDIKYKNRIDLINVNLHEFPLERIEGYYLQETALFCPIGPLHPDPV